MLGTPENGWAEIRIGAFSGWGSFIQDVPVLLLESFTRALSCDLPAEIWIDEEGSRFLIRAHRDTKIVAHQDAAETFRCGAGLRALAEELLLGLDRDWTLWLTCPLANRTGGMSKSELSDFLNHRAAHPTRLTQALARAGNGGDFMKWNSKALGSWSAMRKYLEQEMLAPSLRGRVRYSCTKFPQTGLDGRFGIHVDGEPYKYFSAENIAGSAWDGAKPFDKVRYWEGYWRVKREIPASSRGEFDDSEFAGALNAYRSLPIGDTLNSEDPIVRMFAILDRRTGKRTLAKQVFSDQPPWLQGIYRLRMDAEHILQGEIRP